MLPQACEAVEQRERALSCLAESEVEKAADPWAKQRITQQTATSFRAISVRFHCIAFNSIAFSLSFWESFFSGLISSKHHSFMPHRLIGS